MGYLHDEHPHDEHESVQLNTVAYVGLAYREAKDKYRSDIERDVQEYLRATIAGSMRTD